MKRLSKRLDSGRFRFALSAFLISGVFAPFTLGQGRVTDFAGLISLAVLVALVFRFPLKSFGLTLVTPMLPFVLILLAVAPLQDTLGRAYLAFSLVSAYVLARVIRSLVPFAVSLVGLSAIGVGLGLTYLVSNGPLESWELIRELQSNFGGKNPAGWALVFALVAMISVLVHIIKQPVASVLVATLAGISIVLLIYTNSVTSLIAGIAVILLAGVVSLFRSRKNDVLRKYFRPYSLIFLVATFVAGMLVTSANLVPGVFGQSFDFLRRDFSTATGRGYIWDCYFEAVLSESSRPWEDTMTCTPFPPGHLHSIFLESHLIGGWFLVITLLGGVFAITVLGFLKALLGKSPREISEGFFASGIGVATITIGSVESFIFYPVAYGALVLFFASQTFPFAEGVPSRRGNALFRAPSRFLPPNDST